MNTMLSLVPETFVTTKRRRRLLTADDKAMIKILREDGSKSFSEIAEVIGCTRACACEVYISMTGRKADKVVSIKEKIKILYQSTGAAMSIKQARSFYMDVHGPVNAKTFACKLSELYEADALTRIRYGVYQYAGGQDQ